MNGGIDRRESYHFPQISEGHGEPEGTEKGKQKPYTEKENIRNECKHAGVEGRIVNNLARAKPRDETPPFRPWYNKLLAEASLFDQVYGALPSGRTTPTPMTPICGEERTCSGRLFLPPATSSPPPYGRGLALPSSSQFCNPTLSEGVHEINPAPLTRLRVSTHDCPSPPSEVSTHFSDPPADHSPDVVTVASCAAPTLADTPSRRRLFYHQSHRARSGATASTIFGCVALLDTDSPQTFIRRNILEQMLSGGTATINCEQDSAPLVPGGGLANPFPYELR